MTASHEAAAPDRDLNHHAQRQDATAFATPGGSQASVSASSFGDEDAGFLEALAGIPLTPGTDAESTIRGSSDLGQTTLNTSQRPRRARFDSNKSDASTATIPDLGEMTQWKIVDGTQATQVARSKPVKRARFSSPTREHDEADYAPRPEEVTESSADTPDTARKAADKAPDYLQSATYDALRFGDFSTYMRNKRAKLKVQEHSLLEQEEALLAAAAKTQQTSDDPDHHTVYPPIFKGCTIYINGHTDPPYAELRRLIVLYGGDIMTYLDQKGPVTHIVASNLTPKKRIEFAAYKVVRPEWVMSSIEAAKKLPWQNFKVESDAGGAIGSDRLPTAWAVDGSHKQNNDATSHDLLVGSSIVPAKKVKGYLADATPWGRAVAQRKLSMFQPVRAKAEQSSRESLEDVRSPGRIVLEADTAVKSPEKLLEGLTAENLEKVAQSKSSQSDHSESSLAAPAKDQRNHLDSKFDAMIPDDDAPEGSPLKVPESTSQQQAEAKGSPSPSSPVTASQQEWLSNLETPPRPAKSVQCAEAVEAVPVTPDKEAHVGTDAPSLAAASAGGYFKSGHPYVKNPSNTNAARLLASPSWRERNTATSESFLAGYFAKSRLHYLSTWKGELKDLVSQALRDAGRADGSQPLVKGLSRVIMHVDFDSFFVSVGLRHRPDLKEKPVVVCHAGAEDREDRSGTSSTSEIASCNYVARKFGIQNGWSLGRARQLCPHVQPIPYDFEGYKDVSIQFYSLLLAHADAIEAVSVDEALIDVSRLLQSMRDVTAGNDKISDVEPEERAALLNAYRGHVGSQGDQWTEEKQLAEAIRDEIRRRTGCEASIGIGANVLQARLATRHAKPGGSYHLQEHMLEPFLAELDIDDLQGVGYSTRHRFQSVFGTANIGQLKKCASSARFADELGPRLGRQVWEKMHGVDRAELEGAKQRQSVGAAVNYAIRFKTDLEAEQFVRNLSEEVANRLASYKLKGRQVTVTIMVRDSNAPVEAPKFLGHGICDVHHRSSPTSGPGGAATSDKEHIFRAAWKLIKGLRVLPSELRGIGISCTKLEPSGTVAPPQPKGGQSLLSFKSNRPSHASTSAPITPSPLKRGADQVEQANQAAEDDDSDDETLPVLTPGPSRELAMRVRSRSPSTSPADRKRSEQQSIQPDHTDDQTSTRKRAHSAEAIARPESDTPEHNAPSRASLNVPDVFLPRLGAGPSVRRSARMNRQDGVALPTMSQIDATVLSELPEYLRKEVVRESRKLGSRASTRLHEKGDSREVADPRPTVPKAFSESPKKRQSIGQSKKPSPSNHQRLLQFPFVSRMQPKVDRAAILAMDPARVTDGELKELEIDAEVFRALPLSVQRETLQDSSRRLKGKEARFIGGQQSGVARSIAEERELEAAKAREALDVDATYLVAAPRRNQEDIPSIQKRSSVEDVAELLQTWVTRHCVRLPRRNDVARFSKFLLDNIGESGRPNGLEKVDILLQTWKRLVLRLDKDSKATAGWVQAFEDVRGQVDEAMRLTWGGTFRH